MRILVNFFDGIGYEDGFDQYKESGIWNERRALVGLDGKVPFLKMVDRQLASHMFNWTQWAFSSPSFH